MRLASARAALALAGVAAALLAAATPASAAGPSWQSLTNPPPFNPGVMLLLTDGRVMVQDTGNTSAGTSNWWFLTPDSHGSYAGGTWQHAASMSADYAPLYAASAVLPDGRLIVEGGEYNLGQFVETNKGAIYDPVADKWTTVAPPNGGADPWSGIGDGPSVVLADGSFLLGASGFLGNTAEAILDASNLTWTPTGTGKADGNGEEGFTLLPSGKVLTVDTQSDSCTTGHTETYDPASGTWSSAGSTPTPLIDCAEGEIGPQMLMHDGRVFVEGSTPKSALYDTANGTWSAGPDFPVLGGKQFVASDASSALMPDGRVLVELSPGIGMTPTHFFLFDGTSLTPTQEPADAAVVASNYVYMLMLPTGQALVGPGLQLYSDGGAPDPAWEPQITAVPNDLTAGDTYAVSGTQLNGLSDGAAFGDDWQMSTDYPLVQITHVATGVVTYARTFGMSNRSIAPGAASSSKFTLPICIPQGASHLRVVADGVASAPTPVTVGVTGCTKALTVSSSGSGQGTVTSSPAGIDCGSTCSHPFPDGVAVTLTASPAPGSTFTGWSGACSGTAACTVNLTEDSAVTATFTAKPVCLVPKVTGKRLAAARTAIQRARCRVGKISKAFSAKVKPGRVISQKPRPKTTLAAGSKVRLTVSKGKKR